MRSVLSNHDLSNIEVVEGDKPPGHVPVISMKPELNIDLGMLRAFIACDTTADTRKKIADSKSRKFVYRPAPFPESRQGPLCRASCALPVPTYFWHLLKHDALQ